jgi:hypothetical protein
VGTADQFAQFRKECDSVFNLAFPLKVERSCGSKADQRLNEQLRRKIEEESSVNVALKDIVRLARFSLLGVLQLVPGAAREV